MYVAKTSSRTGCPCPTLILTFDCRGLHIIQKGVSLGTAALSKSGKGSDSKTKQAESIKRLVLRREIVM